MGISIFALVIGAIFVNNVVLAQFLGICPFLGVSKDVKSSLGMGGAVLFVMLLATLATFLINEYVLVPLNLEYLQTIAYILVIAGLVQMVEIVLKKIAPALYQTFAVFLPLITTNCAVLGVALLVVQKGMNLLGDYVISDGNFTVDAQGYLLTQDGDYVLSDKGRIKLDPNKEITVSPDGTISQDEKAVDKIKITDFEDYNYLEHFGENYYYPVDGATTKDAPRTQINQGYLEVSNVSIVSEMVQMIAVSRQYEANQKMIQTIDSSLEIAVNQLGKV